MSDPGLIPWPIPAVDPSPELTMTWQPGGGDVFDRLRSGEITEGWMVEAPSPAVPGPARIMRATVAVDDEGNVTVTGDGDWQDCTIIP